MAKPQSLKEINGKFLLSWAKESKENAAWLKAQAQANNIEVKGITRPNIPVIRLNWAKEFAPRRPKKRKNPCSSRLWICKKWANPTYSTTTKKSSQRLFYRWLFFIQKNLDNFIYTCYNP
mgnify:CR=1 FL=1